jgi:integrase
VNRPSLNLGDLVEDWTLVGAERDLVAGKHRDTQVGFALMLKFYGRFGRFPRGRAELHPDAVGFVAKQLGVNAGSLAFYEWSGRTIKRHRAEIRAHLGFRECTVADAEELTGWLAGDYAQKERRYELVRDALLAECRARSIEPPTPDRVERIVRSGLHQAEKLLAARIAGRLPADVAARLLALVKVPDEVEHVLEVLESVRLFSERADLHYFYPSLELYRANASKQWITHLHQLQVVLFHRGQVATQPRKRMPSWKPPMAMPPRMLAVAQKWLAARRLIDAPSTVDKLELAVRVFGDWLGDNHPEIVTFADVTREHVLAWIKHITETPAASTGRPLGVVSRIQRISGLSQFLRDTAAWQYDDVPGYTLIGPGDAPKSTQRVPRFIPDHELDLLMPVINEIACPFQRAALLVARWSGARRDEIRRLPIDCLDRYPDGTPRLRLPGRKTYKERTVLLHEEAAEALQRVIDLRKDAPERPFSDERTGEQIRYLFMRHGKLLSSYYLFKTSIDEACKAVGLTRPGGKKDGSGVHGTISAHRFRHTVGTAR